MNYRLYLCFVLFTLASCKSSRFTKQRYTHYHVSSTPERARTLTRSTVKNYSAAQACARPDVVLPASPYLGGVSNPPPPNDPPVPSGGWRSPRAVHNVPLPASKQGISPYTGLVKQHFREVKEQQRGPISFLLELIISIVVLVIIVFLVLILLAIL